MYSGQRRLTDKRICVVPYCEQKLYFIWTGKALTSVFSIQLHRIGHHLCADDVSSYGQNTAADMHQKDALLACGQIQS